MRLKCVTTQYVRVVSEVVLMPPPPSVQKLNDFNKFDKTKVEQGRCNVHRSASYYTFYSPSVLIEGVILKKKEVSYFIVCARFSAV